MIAFPEVLEKLTQRYPQLEKLDERVFRAVEIYQDRPYAIRYFDLRDELVATAGQLHKYQEDLLGKTYFDSQARADLRWNHYVYFVTSAQQPNSAFSKAKTAVESDREYARKVVVAESELDAFLLEPSVDETDGAALPADPLSIWTELLEKQNLGFIIDERWQVPAIVRDIAEGEQKPIVRPPTAPTLNDAEQAAPTEFLASVSISGFRKYPVQRSFEFGAVNLILGVNGVGKTSLLEAVEYLFCGRTRRQGVVPPKSAISGVLLNSGLTLQTKTSTTQAALRARHLVWYGKSELRTLTLHDSFSKFNFLDTDAAARLTVEQSRDRIVEDLRQLLLGAEAAKAIDKFGRIARQLEDAKKNFERDISVRESRRAEAAARIADLRNAPRASDQLFNDLRLALHDVGWLQSPADKGDASRVSAAIQAALVNLGVLRAASDTVIPDPAQLESEIQGLEQIESTLDRLVKEEGARKREETRARSRLQVLERQLTAVDALTPIVRAGVREVEQRAQALEQEISDRAARVARGEAAVAALPTQNEIAGASLPATILRWADHVQDAKRSTDAARQALGALESAQSVLTSLRQKLRSAGQELVRHTGDRTHCPLCVAEYSEEVLAERFEALVRGLASDESDRLRRDLQAAEALHQRRVSELHGLRGLADFLGGDVDNATIAEGVSAVSATREVLAALSSELEALRTELRIQGEKGWTFDRLVELASIAGIAVSELTPDRVEVARTAIQDEQSKLLSLVETLESDTTKSQSVLAELNIPYGLENPRSSDLARAVGERKPALVNRRKASVALRDQMQQEPQSPLADLEVRMREAQDLGVQLRTAIAKEQQNSEVIARESQLVSDAMSEIEGLRVKLKRVDAAGNVIQDLLSEHSERLLAEEVLRENAGAISATFAKIHAPNEFDLVANGGLTIVRRGGGNVELDEMSSGQRAAYALSLFLAMNERLRTGPKVLLFDDPVAHVDDINTLSLLDHLRDIALSGRRQIFFATADSKIGALFGRKFRFLGDGFKQIELTRE